jgi:hypothetical protein
MLPAEREEEEEEGEGERGVCVRWFQCIHHHFFV